MSLQTGNLVFTVPGVADGSGTALTVLYTAPYDAQITDLSYVPAGPVVLDGSNLRLVLQVSDDITDDEATIIDLISIVVSLTESDDEAAVTIGGGRAGQIVGPFLSPEDAIIESGKTLLWFSEVDGAHAIDPGGTVMLHVQEIPS